MVEQTENGRVPSLLEALEVEKGESGGDNINPRVLLEAGSGPLDLLMRSRVSKKRMAALLRTRARFALAAGVDIDKVLDMVIAGWTAAGGIPREQYIQGVGSVPGGTNSVRKDPNSQPG